MITNEIKISQEKNNIIITGTLDLLDNISKRIKSEELEDVAHLILNKNKTENSLKFYINKQAAYNNKFHIIDEDMSTLNDIEITINTDNPEGIINWILS